MNGKKAKVLRNMVYRKVPDFVNDMRGGYSRYKIFRIFQYAWRRLRRSLTVPVEKYRFRRFAMIGRTIRDISLRRMYQDLKRTYKSLPRALRAA